MTAQRTRVAVIGLGTMGSQALRLLADEPGVEAVGFEQFTPGHDRGAAGGESRIFRSAQFEDTRYVPILQRADALWRDLEQATGRELRDLVGCVLMGPTDHHQIRTAMESVTDHGLDVELLDPAEAARRFPQFRLDAGDLAVLDRHAGFIRPELTILSAVLLAESRGATVHRGQQVLDLVESAGGVTVVTDTQRVEVDRVIVTAGPWATTLLPDLAELVTVRRPISAWYTSRPGTAAVRGPAFIRTAPRHFYGVPSPDGISVKIGLSVVDHLVTDDPDGVERQVRPAELAEFDEVLANYLPTLQPDPIRLDTYLEGYTDDSRPVIRVAPDSPDVVVLAGFSGHGFKLAPAIGEIGVDLALGRAPRVDLTFLDRAVAAAV